MAKRTASGKIKAKPKPWTEARKKAFIQSVLRTGMLRWPAKHECLHKAKVGKKENKKTKRQAMHFKCAECNEEFTRKDIQVDHKKPVVDPRTGFNGWNEYIDRLYCKANNLQVLCAKCHKIKTDKETKRRKK